MIMSILTVPLMPTAIVKVPDCEAQTVSQLLSQHFAGSPAVHSSRSCVQSTDPDHQVESVLPSYPHHSNTFNKQNISRD